MEVKRYTFANEIEANTYINNLDKSKNDTIVKDGADVDVLWNNKALTEWNAFLSNRVPNQLFAGEYSSLIEYKIKEDEKEGIDFYNEVRALVKKHHLKGTITDAQLKAIKVTLEPALRPLKLGDWDIAQDNINAINRPNGVLSKLYDFVKNKIDNYLGTQV